MHVVWVFFGDMLQDLLKPCNLLDLLADKLQGIFFKQFAVLIQFLLYIGKKYLEGQYVHSEIVTYSGEVIYPTQVAVSAGR